MNNIREFYGEESPSEEGEMVLNVEYGHLNIWLHKIYLPQLKYQITAIPVVAQETVEVVPQPTV